MNLLTAMSSPPLHRIVVDDMLSSVECNDLVNAAREYAITGDGYKTGKPSPHTEREHFVGLSIRRAAKLTQSGVMDIKILRILLVTTGRIKAYVERTFGLYGLHFAYTHLVGRSALPDSNSTEKFSHSIHADNCNLREDGRCDRKSPAYIWRDYSAIIYLNDDFTGGELIFTKDLQGEIVERTVKPKCGRVVAFSSGNENIHGVRAVTNGSRFALGLWFTFSPEYAEVDRRLAYEIFL